MRKSHYLEGKREGVKTVSPIYPSLKRTIDLIVSLSLLIFLAPLLVLFALAIVCTAGRPILFKQTRMGTDKRKFEIWKFRTMGNEENAKTLHAYDWSDGVPNNFFFEKPTVQKITKIGKVYRKLSIDELPQLVNVLRGDMSLVGPRPEMIEISNLYNERQATRLTVKPGITGYAQVNGRSAITHGEKIEHDLYYVENRSLMMDIKIILKTIVLVIRGKEAY
ncbi:sugar transferase [Sporosarcina sp. BI001-red]|uniref:sugar transferase n=1 Tax=Sporosarcina sp. BI001-red TaxID=2282866 RepID=UPI000E2530D0|nr:sugar transferase [Sporosarcina sp. BI001-red]REB08735.1 sugar transferase [Sporosarcina sp. BI001-red]